MILDSGERREFKSGAVRDIQEGKGRCDLLPLHEVSGIIFDKGTESEILEMIHRAIEDKNECELLYVAKKFSNWYMDGVPNAMLELAVHFEDGAKKYGEYNWQKGIPAHCYLDSAIRHFLKVLRGDVDENHKRAFLWNII